MANTVTKEFDGKVALVTGAARNMGRAFAVAFAAGGADVVVHYHSGGSREDAEETARQIEKEGARALLVQGDLSDKVTVASIFTDVLSTFGGIDIVINNAGAIVKKALADLSEDDFDSVFRVNTKAPFLVMQEAARVLRENGRIINMGTSLLAAYTGFYGIYAGSKAPLEHFTRALSKEIGARGITVNMVAPGPIDTPFMHGEETPETVAYLTSASPLARLGHVEDVVPVVEFLASEKARWVTGQTVLVNGGFVTR